MLTRRAGRPVCARGRGIVRQRTGSGADRGETRRTTCGVASRGTPARLGCCVAPRPGRGTLWVAAGAVALAAAGARFLAGRIVGWGCWSWRSAPRAATSARASARAVLSVLVLRSPRGEPAGVGRARRAQTPTGRQRIPGFLHPRAAPVTDPACRL